MPWWADLLISLGAALLLVWVVLVVVMWRTGRGMSGLAEAARLLPDLLRLVGRLARDPELPRGLRIRLWILLAWLASPIDLLPEFIPVIGYADDVVVAAYVLRSVVRIAGPEALDRHWPGTPEGLDVVRRLAGVR